MISISTAWNVTRHSDAKKMVKEIKSMGFNTIELNFTISKKMLKDIKDMVDQGIINVSSIHNICPMPDDVDIEQASPDYYSMSSTDEYERSLAVKLTKGTIDTAVSLRAQAVVLHAGYVDIRERIRSLMNLYQAGKKGTDEYNNLIEQMRKERNTFSQSHMQSLLTSLKELDAYAKEKNIKLGIENRYYFREMPSIDEIGTILDLFPDSNIFYWHDVGHAQVFENLGLVSHMDFLKRYGNRLIGIHLHNIRGTNDHRAPLDGDFDFSLLKPYVKKGILLVIESHYPATKKQIMDGKKYLEELLKEA